jgi:hypothetical protein
MRRRLSNNAQQVMMLAGQHARRLNHAYVGTEHILLGLMSEQSGQIADLLSSLGAGPTRMEQEIEKLIAPGPAIPLPQDLPLTPRAKTAIELASHQAAMLSEKCVEPGHLLLGLILLDDGVAAQALRNAGLDSRQAAHLAVKDRLEQMKIIERIVRPMRTPVARKRKMREEFLAHLEELYEEEHARLHDRPAALAAAAVRFGDPAKLSAELDGAVSLSDRATFYAERWLMWRAPEPALAYTTRVAVAAFLICAVAVLPAFVLGLFMQGIGENWLGPLRAVAAFLVFMPAAQFGLGLSYLKLRDALWGVFGSRKSLLRAFSFAGVNALVVMVCGLGFIAMADWNLAVPEKFIPSVALAGLLAAMTYGIAARFRGPREIRDTFWALLKIDGDVSQTTT